MKNYRTVIFFMLFFAATSFITHAQEVRFGSRPPIDLDMVSPESFEPGHFRVRFTKPVGEHFDMQPVQRLNGELFFGIEALDALRQEADIQDARQSFETQAFHNQFTERHRQWGLHLWYDMHVDESADIIELVRMFEALDEVDVAEPVYRKQLVSGEVFDWNEDAFIRAEQLDEWIPNDPQFGSQWHYKNTGQTGGTTGADIKAHLAWTIEKGNADVIVAIVDDGIQFNHPDLAANMWEDIGFNFVDNNANVVPGDHGTHVAGTVAAVSNNNVGVSGVAGGSGSGDGVRLMSAQVFRGFTSGGFHLAPVWAADNGAAISQNSWGYTQAGVFEQAVLDAIDYFNANGGGDVMDGGITIFAAGNSGSSGNYYPGFYEGAMSVAATNHNDQRSNYSTYGTWVDISAPGGETNVANNRGVLSTVTGSGYAFYQGTSMACPHVSGAAALILSYAPGVLNNEDLFDILVGTTDDHYDVNPGFIGQLGSGRLNAFAALNEVDNYLAGLINPSSFSVNATGVDVIEISWNQNPNNDPILLAFSEEGVFGTPEGMYDFGDEIDGGGFVLLAGEETSFTHTGLEAATTYYYRIWSNQDGAYSSGRSGSTSTLCGIFTLPFIEDFSDGELPLCWETGGWQIGSFSGGLNIDGNYAYSGTGLGGGQTAHMVSPFLDFSNFEDVTVSFQHYFRATFLGGTSGTFAYSTNGGQSWTTIQSWSSTTSNPASYQTSLPELAGEPMVMFRWTKSIGFLGYYWTMGNLAINGTAVDMPIIHVDPDNLMVEMEAGESMTEHITVTNIGNSDLLISDVHIQYHDDTTDFITTILEDDELMPDQETTLTVEFNARSLEHGDYHATIIIESNDPNQAEMHIPVVMHILEQPEIFDVTFTIEDQIGNNITEATIILDGVENEPGNYLFESMPPGTYNLEVIMACYINYIGEVTIVDDHVNQHLILDNILGDANDDGLVNVLDIINIVGFFSGEENENFCFHNADLNQDGVVDILDVIGIVNIFSEGKAYAFPGLKSEEAHIFLHENGIALMSDGTLAGLQFELKGENLKFIDMAFDLPNHKIAYAFEDGLVKAMIYSYDNTPIPEGRIELVSFDNPDSITDWGVAFAGNLNAEHVHVNTYSGEETGTADISLSESLQVYPNPASEFVTVSFYNTGNDTEVSIINMAGQRIQSQLIQATSGYVAIDMSLSGINPGMYFLVINNDQQVTRKLMVR